MKKIKRGRGSTEKVKGAKKKVKKDRGAKNLKGARSEVGNFDRSKVLPEAHQHDIPNKHCIDL